MMPAAGNLRRSARKSKGPEPKLRALQSSYDGRCYLPSQEFTSFGFSLMKRTAFL